MRCIWFITYISCILIATSCCLAFTFFANLQRVTTLLNILMHNYNHYLYHVAFIHILTLYIIKLCNCSPDYMFIIMYFWPNGLWPSGLNKMSCLVNTEINQYVSIRSLCCTDTSGSKISHLTFIQLTKDLSILSLILIMLNLFVNKTMVHTTQEIILL